MDSLTKLKGLVKTNKKIKIKKFNGMVLDTSLGCMMIADGTVFVDGKPIEDKKLMNVIENYDTVEDHPLFE